MVILDVAQDFQLSRCFTKNKVTIMHYETGDIPSLLISPKLNLTLDPDLNAQKPGMKPWQTHLCYSRL